MQGTDPTTLELRDIHLPESVLWWPPAPGWWILLFLIFIIALSIIFIIRRRHKKRLSAIYIARQELNRIQKQFESNQDNVFLIKEISELIRRVSISLFKRSDAASLTGQEWLLFLDELNGDKSFSEGIGRVLIEAPYQANPEYDEKELLKLISTWIDSAESNAGQKENQK